MQREKKKSEFTKVKIKNLIHSHSIVLAPPDVVASKSVWCQKSSLGGKRNEIKSRLRGVLSEQFSSGREI